ncbi:MAG: response regulator [Planctomycetota bacterium]
MRSILFVDDEQRVLDGLQRMLRPMRTEWDMAFVTGGAVAIALLDERRFDVIVTDMRMPGMDGAHLLAVVHERWPDTIRIVLSGHSDQEMALRAVPVAHQFLSKPIDAALLKEVIERASAFRDRMQNQQLRQMVGQIGSLPPLPRIYQELMTAVDRPQVSARDIARIVERDPALAGNLLKLVNSSFFGLTRSVATIDGAIAYLGVNTIKSLALTAEVFRPVAATEVEGYSVDRMQACAMTTARIASGLVRDRAERDAALLAGLLHDVGEIVLLRTQPRLLAEVIRVARAEAATRASIERRLWGVSHAEVGAYLLGIWGLPGPIVEAVAYHHEPSRLQSSRFDMAGAVHVADVLATGQLADGAGDGLPAAEIDQAYLEAVGMAHELPRWRSLAGDESPQPEGASRP